MTSSASPPSQPPAVGLIGLGLIGSALAERLLGAGQRVVGWDIDPARVTALRQGGGEIAASADEVFSTCRSRVVEPAQPSRSRRRDRGGRQLPEPRPHDHRHDHRRSRQHPGAGEDARRSRDHLPGRHHLRQQRAGPGRHGDADGRRRRGVVRGVLAIFSSRLGSGRSTPDRPDTGAKMKLVTNLVLGLNRAALAEGLAFAESLGLDLALSLAVMRGSAAYSRIMDTQGRAHDSWRLRAGCAPLAAPQGRALDRRHRAARSGCRCP